jgi:hypothetical protein
MALHGSCGVRWLVAFLAVPKLPAEEEEAYSYVIVRDVMVHVSLRL